LFLSPSSRQSSHIQVGASAWSGLILGVFSIKKLFKSARYPPDR
jgi:hypothetical protein